MSAAVDWRPRHRPLEAVAVAARGEPARILAQKLLAREDTVLAGLQGACGPGTLLLLGPAEALPWADGAFYLGRDASAPALLLPTTLEPSVPLPLLERALRRLFPDLLPPLALLPSLLVVLSAGTAQTVARPMLAHWLEANP